jgi:hypothetical protein
MALEKKYLAVNTSAFVPPPNGEVNGEVVLTNAAGTALFLPALPTANGDYTLRVTGGPSAPVYTWVLEGT